jgi:actin-like ATPase involved in cell morphogenesis
MSETMETMSSIEKKSSSSVYGIDLGTSTTVVTSYSSPEYAVMSTPFSGPDSKIIPSIISVDPSVLVLGGVRIFDGEVLLPLPNIRGYSYKIGYIEGGGKGTSVSVVTDFKPCFNEERNWEGLGRCQGRVWTYYFLGSLLSYLSPSCVCVTHPSGWSSTAKTCLLEILQKLLPAGSRCSVWSESTAAAICYQANYRSSSLLSIVDVGAGTTDVSVVRFEEDGSEEVVRVCGCATAGNDVDKEIVNLWLGSGKGGSRETLVVSRDAKVRLCGRRMWDYDDLAGLEDYVEAESEVELLCKGVDSRVLSQAELNAILETKIFPAISKTIQKAFAKLKVEAVILLGGGSHLLKLEELLRTNAPKAKILTDVNPFTPVSIGACIRASVEAGEREEWEVKRDWGDLVPFDLGVGEGENFVKVVEAGAKTPVRTMVKFDTETESQPGVTVSLYERIRDDKFAVVGNFTFMLHRPTPEQLEGLEGVRSLELWVELGTDGSVKVEIFDELDSEHRRKWGRDATGGTGSGPSGTEVFLAILVFVLVVLYLGVRIAFNEIQMEESQANVSADKEAHSNEEF